MTIDLFLNEAASSYAQAKAALEAWTGASQDLLHVHAGLAIFVITALVLKKRMRSPVPLAFVALFAVLNEAVDRLNGVPFTTGETLGDIANTLVWPVILFLLARRWR